MALVAVVVDGRGGDGCDLSIRKGSLHATKWDGGDENIPAGGVVLRPSMVLQLIHILEGYESQAYLVLHPFPEPA